MRYIILFFGLLFFNSHLRGQSFDAAKMNSDMQIAEAMLESIAKEQFEGGDWEETVEGAYIEDYGVIFTIRTSAEATILGLGNNNIKITSPRIRMKGLPAGITITEEDNNLFADKFDENVKSIAVTFLKDYAQLIKQLEVQEKILLTFVDDFEENYAFAWIDGSSAVKARRSTFTAEVLKKDIEDYKSLKIKEEEFINRIKITKRGDEKVSNPDVERLITIFERLYHEDNSKLTLMLSDMNQYTYVEGLGVVVNFNLHDTEEYNEFDQENQMTRQQIEEAEKAQQEALKKRFDAFIKTFKENAIEYGRTVKSLKSDEMLIFKLQVYGLASNQAEVSVKKSVLDDYDQRNISLAQALEKVRITTDF